MSETIQLLALNQLAKVKLVKAIAMRNLPLSRKAVVCSSLTCHSCMLQTMLGRLRVAAEIDKLIHNY